MEGTILRILVSIAVGTLIGVLVYSTFRHGTPGSWFNFRPLSLAQGLQIVVGVASVFIAILAFNLSQRVWEEQKQMMRRQEELTAQDSAMLASIKNFSEVTNNLDHSVKMYLGEIFENTKTLARIASKFERDGEKTRDE